jgi:hypothetical protein
MRRGNGAYLVMEIYCIGNIVIEGIKLICGRLGVESKRTSIDISRLNCNRRSPIIIINASGPSRIQPRISTVEIDNMSSVSLIHHSRYDFAVISIGA